MCQFKSGIILKDRIVIPDHDHHSTMLVELGIKDDRKNAESMFVRAELVPSDNDPFSDIDDWNFVVDQDIIPEWFVADYEKERMIAAVKEWAKTHVYIGVDGLELSTGTNYYLKDCKNVTLKGNASVKRLENSNVGVMRESSNVGEMRGSSIVTIPDDYRSRNVKQDSIVLCDNATIKDNRTKTLCQSGDWRLVLVENKEE